MALTDQTTFVEYAGSGTAGSSYAITFTFQNDADVVCFVDGVAYTTFSIVGTNVVATTAIDTDETFRIERQVDLEQTLSLVVGGDLPSALTEQTLDRIVMMIQEQSDDLGRTVRMGRGYTPNELDVTPSRYVYLDASGNPVVRTAAQLAADVQTELALNSEISDKVTVTVADATARDALAPAFTGQLLIQLDSLGVLWIGTGTSVGNWSHLSNNIDLAPSVRVADVATRDLTVPAFVGQYCYQDAFTAWFIADGYAAGDWASVTAWSAGETYTAGDIMQGNTTGMLWEALDTHTSAAWNEPGVGAGWETHWKPWLVDGFHYTVEETDSHGTTSTRELLIGDGNLLPKWSASINWLIPNKLAAAGGGDDLTAWIDGTPFGDPADWATATEYNAGDHVVSGGDRYKCHTYLASSSDGGGAGTDEGAGDNEPGVGTDWETYWILRATDPRVFGRVEFTGGTYVLEASLLIPAQVTLAGRLNHSRQATKFSAASGFSGSYLYEGVYRDRDSGTGELSGNTNFYTSIFDLHFDCNDLAHGILWVASHGSELRAEIIDCGYKIPLVIGNNCDDWIATPQITDTGTPSKNSPYGIYIAGASKSGRIRGAVIGRSAVGLSCGDVQGLVVEGSEMEGVALPFEIRCKEDDAHYTSTWATSTAYEVGERVLHNSTRYRCFVEITSSTSAEEPGVGADWADYFEEIGTVPGVTTDTQGRDGGITFLGGRWNRPQSLGTVTESVGFIRVHDSGTGGPLVGTNLIGVYLGNNDGATTWTAMTVQELGAGAEATYDYPLVGNLTHGLDSLVCNWSTVNARRFDHAFQNAAVPGGSSGTGVAKTVDSRWVTTDNPATFTTNSNEDVTLPAGHYEVELTGTWDTGSIAIIDEDTNPLPGLGSVTEDRTRWILHSGGTVNVAMSSVGAGTSVTVYFKPRIM